ncbi:MAG: hypothetical protein ABSA59_07445 [Terriglobia bacterium]
MTALKDSSDSRFSPSSQDAEKVEKRPVLPHFGTSKSFVFRRGWQYSYPKKEFFSILLEYKHETRPNVATSWTRRVNIRSGSSHFAKSSLQIMSAQVIAVGQIRAAGR